MFCPKCGAKNDALAETISKQIEDVKEYSSKIEKLNNIICTLFLILMIMAIAFSTVILSFKTKIFKTKLASLR